MTLPTPSDVHVNRPLTNMCLAFMPSLDSYQADNICPIFPVQKKSDLYFKLLKEYWFSNIMRKRGVSAPAIRHGYGVTQDSYLCDLWAVGKPIDDQTRANEDSPLNSDRTAMKFVTRALLMNREKEFHGAVWGTSKWTTDLVGNSSASAIANSGTFNQWDDPDSTPITDVEDMKEIMEKLTGMTPNSLSMGAQVWKALKSNPQILEKITGGSSNTNPARVTKALVAQLFEIDEIVVLRAIENTAGHGNTFTGDYIFGKEMLFTYKDGDMGVETATAMRTITWQQLFGNANGTRILKWRDESIHSDIIEAESTFVHKIISPDLGIFCSTAVA